MFGFDKRRLISYLQILFTMAEIHRYEFRWALIDPVTKTIEAGNAIITERNPIAAYQRFKKTDDFSRIKEITPFAQDFFQIRATNYTLPEDAIRIKRIL